MTGAAHSEANRKADASAVPKVNPRIYDLIMWVMILLVVLRRRRIEIHGRQNVPPPGTPLVIAANHQDALDPFVVATILPQGRWLQFMAKKELFLPVIGWFIRSGGSFPVDREANDVQAVRTAVRILQGGGTVGIFPQGTRGGHEMHGGAALIAAKGRAAILPVGLSARGRRWIVNVGTPIAAGGGIKATTEELGRRLDELSTPI